jgi:hypothetical protein
MGDINIQSSSQGGIVAKLLSSVVFLAFLVGGCFMEQQISRDFFATLATYFWNATPCTIDQSGIDEKLPYKFQVDYSYDFAGQKYSSNVLSNGYKGSTDYYVVQKLFDRYPAGSSAMCRVDPHDPTRAVLQTRSLWGGFGMLFPLPFILIGGGLLYVIWKPPPPQTKPRPKVNLKHPNLAGGILFGVFFMIGAGVMAYAVPMVLRGRAAQSWPMVPSVIDHATVARHTGSKNTTYSVEVLFHYRYGAKRYGSSRYELINSTSSDRGTVEQQADDLMSEPRRSCYVNPLDPADAVMDRSYISGIATIAGTGAVFMLVGGGGMFLIRRGAKAQHHAKIEEQLADNARMPTVLKPTMSIRLKFIVGFAVTLIWDGVVVLLAWIVYSGRQGNRAMTIYFLIAFGVVGIILLVAMLRSARQLLYPIPHLTLTKHPIWLSENAEVHWEWLGPYHRLTGLKLAIAVFRLPSNQPGYGELQKRHPLWQQPIFETTQPSDLQMGHHAFVIPPEVMPSAEDNSRIVWAILLDAAFSQPGQLKLEFPINVVRGK